MNVKNSINAFGKLLNLSTLIAAFLAINISTALATPQYQNFDGTENNELHPEWGAADTALIRLTGIGYDDGIWQAQGEDLPSARMVSNAVSAQSMLTVNKFGASDILWQWGQFIDHDITLTEAAHNESLAIHVPMGDEFFDPRWSGQAEIDFSRSEYMHDSGTDLSNPREHPNQITAFIDGSMVYGSDDATAASLRSGEGGRLATSFGDLLPRDADGNFLAGDVRVNEQVGLTSMHTLFMREHNRQADLLAQANPTWDDETIFQNARSIVIGEIQSITYNEFLPTLLGSNAPGEYSGYDPTVNPGIATEFSTAAFRVGHTMLPSTLLRLDENWQEIDEGHLALRDAFFNPYLISEQDDIDAIFRGLMFQQAQAIDPMLADDIRNFLFGPPGAGGFDLAALNIQRGRDHGLMGYNDSRELLGLERIADFDDPIFQDGFGDKLRSVYDSVDDIELWIGGLSERAFKDGMLGEVFSLILSDQFSRLRDGDRYWYLNNLVAGQTMDIDSIRLADIIRWNTNISSVPNNVFIAQVPEPASLLMLGLGAFAGARLRRRKD
jgi:hypothetical protein